MKHIFLAILALALLTTPALAQRTRSAMHSNGHAHLIHAEKMKQVHAEKMKQDKDRDPSPDNDKNKGKHKGETQGKHKAKGHRH